MKYIVLKSFLEGVPQIHKAPLIDLRFGCHKLKDPRYKKICRLKGKLRILSKRYNNCTNDRCRNKIQQQIAKWQEKHRNELMKSKINRDPAKLK